jgi:hypothetical protein
MNLRSAMPSVPFTSIRDVAQTAQMHKRRPFRGGLANEPNRDPQRLSTLCVIQADSGNPEVAHEMARDVSWGNLVYFGSIGRRTRPDRCAARRRVGLPRCTFKRAQSHRTRLALYLIAPANPAGYLSHVAGVARGGARWFGWPSVRSLENESD